MSDKRKKRKFDNKRERRRRKRLAEDGRLVNGAELPRGAVPADPSQQVPNNSYSRPPRYYLDTEFTCEDCGRKEVWTAEQQKWYYEVVKGPRYAQATRCRKCRRKRSERDQGRGDPNPIKHVGSLMKRIRKDVEPCLMDAGFEFDERSWGTDRDAAWLGYARPGLILQFLFQPREAQLIAETMDDRTVCRVIADADLACSPSALLDRVDEFIGTVREYVRMLPAAGRFPKEDAT